MPIAGLQEPTGEQPMQADQAVTTKPELKPAGMMGYVAGQTLDKHDKDSAEYEENKGNTAVIDSIAMHVRKSWEAARQAKLNQQEERLLSCLRQRNGEYDPNKLAKIRAQGGSELFMQLTNIKCRAAESWINDIMFQAGENTWDIKPTPIPDLPDHIEEALQEKVVQEAMQAAQFAAATAQQPITPEDLEQRLKDVKSEFMDMLNEEANRRSSAMKTKIEDQLMESEWESALKEFIKDITTFPLAILRGPIIRRKTTLQWGVKGGKWMPIIGSVLKLEFYRVAPFDFYPAPDSRNVNDGYLCERHRLRRSQLVSMKGAPGYKTEAIEEVLQQFGRGGLRQWLTNDFQRAELEGRDNEWLNSDTIDCIEFSGQIQGKMLIEWGMSKDEITNETDEYEANVWLIGTYVIKAVLNDDPLKRRNYHTACFEKVPGSIWGIALPELMSDTQDVCNACARAIVNNMGMASGPMMDVSTDRLAAGEEVSSVSPWRVLQTVSDPNGTNTPAVRFFQPNLNTDPLIKVYDHFSKLADEHTGVPSYTYGDPAGGGAAGTASGLSMLMTAASRGIKMVVSNIDKPVSDTVKAVYEHNMLYDEDESIKGDVNINARGSSSLIAKEQRQMRLNEALGATNNPVDMAIIGNPGRATLLREAMKSLDIVVDEVVPDDDELRDRIQAEMQSQLAIEGKTQDAAGNPAGGQENALF